MIFYLIYSQAISKDIYIYIYIYTHTHKGNLPFNALYRSREALYAGAMKKRWARNNFLWCYKYRSSIVSILPLLCPKVTTLPLELLNQWWPSKFLWSIFSWIGKMNILQTHRSCAGIILHLLDCPSRIKHLG